jgi:periplasmic divalent cation tolerance protein
MTSAHSDPAATSDNIAANRPSTDAQVVFITHPNLESAKSLARQLVQAHLVACVNLIPNVHSIYFWQQQVCEDSEVLLICKTLTPQLEPLMNCIKQHHPYQVPEFVVMPITAGSTAYLQWIGEVCTLPPQTSSENP